MHNKNIILDVKNLTKKFGDLVAVDNVSLKLEEEETIGVVGESGCGKSTLGKSILKLLKPEEGKIYLKGKEILSLKEKEFRSYREEIQMLFQNPLTSFNPLYNIKYSIKEFSKLNKNIKNRNDLNNKMKEELKKVNLPKRVLTSKPNELSGGQLQRAALARALITDPKIIILDEPTSALDMSTRGQIINLLQKLQNETGISYMIISHDLRVIKSITHNIYVMYLGQIVEKGSNKKLFNKPLHPYTRALLNAASIKIQIPNINEQKDNLIGEVTQSDLSFSGCKLAPRCQYSEKRCFNEKQKILKDENNHFVRCWKYKKINKE